MWNNEISVLLARREKRKNMTRRKTTGKEQELMEVIR